MRVIPELVATHRVIAPDLPGHGRLGDGDGERRRRRAGWRADRRHVPGAAGRSSARARRRDRGPVRRRAPATARPPRAGRRARPDRLRTRRRSSALALHAFLADPSEDTHDELWRHCALDLDAAARADGRALGAVPRLQRRPRREARRDGRARRPDGRVRHAAIPPRTSRGIAVPTTLIWGRHDRRDAAVGRRGREPRYGWPLHVIEDCADDPPLEQPAAFLRALRAALGPARSPRRLRRRDRRPRPPALRRAAQGLQRDDRPPAGADRALRGRARRRGRGRLRARRTACRVSVYGGGHNVTGNAVCDDGVDDRPAADEGDRDRPRAAHLPRRGRAHLGRARRRHAGARPRRDRRPDVDHRPRRARRSAAARAGSSASAATRSTTCSRSRS